MRFTAFTRTVMATAVAVATVVAGVAGQAQAFSFGEGDLVLAIYGNNTEALYNLGQTSSIFASGPDTTLDVTAGVTAAAVGANPVKYTLFSWSTIGGNSIHAGTGFTPAAINPAQVQLTFQFEPSIGMSSISNFTGNTIAKADIKSFSSNLNTAGAGKFEGAWPVAMEGQLGNLLNILRGNVDTNAFTQVGRALLALNGTGQYILAVGNPGPAAIPLPAGVVLFGTGLIALVGIARRSFNRMGA